MKKTKKALALALALAVAGTTNLGGLQDICKIHAGTTYYKTFTETINGVEWQVECRYDVSTGPIKYYNTKTTVLNKEMLANKTVVIPEKVGDCPLTVISENCFSDSDIAGVIFNENIKTIEERAFQGCSKLKTVEYKGNDLPDDCFSQCTALEEVKISGSGTVTLGESAFWGNTSLKKLEIADTVSSLIVEDLSFYGDTMLSDISALPDVTLGNGSFAYCGSLKSITFNGSVKYQRTNGAHYDYGTFLGSFDQSEEEKEVVFNGNADIPENFFDSCTGLNKVTINSTATLGNKAFYNCKDLSTVQFGTGKITLGNSVFSCCDSLKELQFQSDVDMISNPTIGTGYTQKMYEGTLANYSLNNCSYPFANSSIESIRFYNGTVEIYINEKSIKELYFNTSKLYGGIGDACTSLNTVVFENSDQLGGIEPIWRDNKHYYTFLNKCTHKCTVIGYSSVDLDYKIVENWINELEENVRNKITFQNIILSDTLTVTYDGKIIGDNSKIEDFDKNKLKVSAYYYDFANKSYYMKDVNPSTNDTDVTGYTIILPSSLHNGSNLFSVNLSGYTKNSTVEIVKQAPESIKIDWKEKQISELVSNQPITSTDVISGASVTYNDGTVEYVTADQLSLNKTVTTAGDNTFIATLNGTDIKAEKTFSIRENYITSINAEYISNDTVYAGDKIDPSKIKLTPTYKYDNDETVNRNIVFTKISASTFTEVGINQITVSYNDLETTLVVSATAVVPTKLYATFDNNYKYYEGQDSINPKSIAVIVEYNNGTKKSGADIAYAYEVKEIIKTDTILQATVSYKGLETTVNIPVTPNEIADIKASTNIASATEGTTLAKTIIDKIELTYNNGKTETLDATTIDYNSLTFDNYVIAANEKNTITINYAGRSTEIIIVGVPNTITSIYAEYIGNGQTVGTQVPVSDIAVHAINSNGQITTIKDGIVLENAIPYNVGVNTVTVHYGSFSCTITVMGLPTTSTKPSKTSQPDATTTPIETETPNNTTVVSKPDTANNAPVIANTAISVKSNNSKIKLSTNKTYKVYTNKTVTFTMSGVSSSAIKYQVIAKNEKLSDTAWKNVTNNKIIVAKTAKPSIVYIQYTDDNGVIHSIHTNGFTIDKKKAMVNIKKNKTYKSGKKVTFKDASGIKSAKLDGKNVKSGIKINKKGTHTLVVTDKAGNKTTVKFKIK